MRFLAARTAELLRLLGCLRLDLRLGAVGLDHLQAGVSQQRLRIDARRRPRLDPRLGSFLAHGLRFNRQGGFLAQPLQGFFPLQLFFALMGGLRA